jgi:hypothetical protein
VRKRSYASIMSRAWALTGCCRPTGPIPAPQLMTSLTKTALLPYRQALIRELRLESTAELMLLDLVLISYAEAYNFEAFTAWATKDKETGDGLIRGKGDFVRVVSGLGRAYASQFAYLLQTLVNLKKPPIQVKVERAGTVAVQVNEGRPAKQRGSEKPAPAPAAQPARPSPRRHCRARLPAPARPQPQLVSRLQR